MSKLVLWTQVYENYAWNEDGSLGTGADAYWKAKGGSEYVVLRIDVNKAKDIAEQATKMIDRADDYFSEHVIAWEVVDDDYLTDFERSQLEYDGVIVYPAEQLFVECV